MEIQEIAFYVIWGLIIYFLPTFITILTNTGKTAKRFAINLMWGWTIVGWIALMYLSITNKEYSVSIEEEQIKDKKNGKDNNN